MKSETQYHFIEREDIFHMVIVEIIHKLSYIITIICTR